MEFYQKKITQSQYRRSVQGDDTAVDIELTLPVLEKTDESVAYFNAKITALSTQIADIMLPTELEKQTSIEACVQAVLSRLGLD